MKPLYSPAEVQFKPMKEDVKDIFEDPVFKYFPEPIEKSPAGWYCWEREYPDEGGIRVIAPFTPGEKCYLKEAWALVKMFTDDAGNVDWIEEWDKPLPKNKPKGWDIVYDTDWQEAKRLSMEDRFIKKWRSPVTMPQWAARRFFTIVSCTPMRIGEVTEEDVIRAGAYATVWGVDDKDWSGLPGHPHQRISYKNGFSNMWEKKHPSTWPDLWVWKVEVKEEK